jgi:hypothetical protein
VQVVLLAPLFKFRKPALGLGSIVRVHVVALVTRQPYYRDSRKARVV